MNPNQADICIAVSGADLPLKGDFSLLCYMFDGRDEMTVMEARNVWKALKDQAHELTYWQQTDKGWEKKA